MSETVPNEVSCIFICYRREEAISNAGRLHDRLCDEFGNDRVFMDIDTIMPGDDFVEKIDDAIGSCSVLLAIIGRQWLNVPDSSGQRRLDNPNDFVRLEIATALAKGVRVIPLLVNEATMPSGAELPEDIAKLSRRQALEISERRWAHDIGVLIDTLKRVDPRLAELPSKEGAAGDASGEAQTDVAGKPSAGVSVPTRWATYNFVKSANIIKTGILWFMFISLLTGGFPRIEFYIFLLFFVLISDAMINIFTRRLRQTLAVRLGWAFFVLASLLFLGWAQYQGSTNRIPNWNSDYYFFFTVPVLILAVGATVMVAFDIQQAREHSFRWAGFLTLDEVRGKVAPLLEPGEHLEKELLFYSTERQRTWLVASDRRLFFIVDNSKTRESGRVMHSIKPKSVILSRRQSDHRGEPAFVLGKSEKYRYSAHLFKTWNDVDKKFEELVS